MKNVKTGTDAIYKLDEKLNIFKAIPFGLQHILAMFVANITPIIIIAGVCGLTAQDTAMVIQSAMIIAGIGTFVQLFPIWRVGSRLPIVMGISFTFVSLACVIGAQYGYGAVLGAVFVGGIVEGILGLFAKYWIKIVAPIVAATVVTAIGFSLLPVGAASFGGGTGAEDFGSPQNWILGTVTLIGCLIFNTLAKGYLKQLSVLFGLVLGYIIALFMGMVDFSAFADVQIITFPHILPFKLEFNANAIIGFILIFLVSATETIGDTSALASSGLGRDVTEKETAGSIACDGFISSISSLFGCMPITSFSQNVGLVAMTKVVNRYAIATGAGIMVLAGFFPAVGALLATLPSAVLGGCTIMMFGNIVISGLQMIGKCGFTQRNITIAALSLSIGLGFTQCPQLFGVFSDMTRTVFAENCVAVVFVTAILLNILLPKNIET